jgi:hypothetical protein
MFLSVSIPRVTSALLAYLLAAAGSGAAAAVAGTSSRPTPAQIHAALQGAERSPDLWATVNVCNTKHHRHWIGIRGQMPGLGFRTALSLEIRFEYWRFDQKRWAVVPRIEQSVRLGSVTSGLRQGGFSQPFNPFVLLRGAVTFKWTLAGKVLGHTARTTGRGYKHVDFGDPPGYSRATCVIR